MRMIEGELFLAAPERTKESYAEAFPESLVI
jgi:hypothetical protein